MNSLKIIVNYLYNISFEIENFEGIEYTNNLGIILSIIFSVVWIVLVAFFFVAGYFLIRKGVRTRKTWLSVLGIFMMGIIFGAIVYLILRDNEREKKLNNLNENKKRSWKTKNK